VLQATSYMPQDQ